MSYGIFYKITNILDNSIFYEIVSVNVLGETQVFPSDAQQTPQLT